MVKYKDEVTIIVDGAERKAVVSDVSYVDDSVDSLELDLKD